jgi:hypothetical protein
MPSDNVTPLFGEAETYRSATREEVLSRMAGTFDGYVQEYGCEPEAFFVVMTGRASGAQMGVYVDERANASYIDLLAKASVILTAAAQRAFTPPE